MTEINNISGTQNITTNQSSSKKQISNQDKKDSASIFGDKNNNGIVDKDDFSNSEIAVQAEAKGLFGKSWDSLKDSINTLLSAPQAKPLNENAQKEKNDNIAFLKEKNIPYKENADGSVEYEIDGHIEKLSWDGDNSIVEFKYSNGNTVKNSYNNKDKSSTLAFTNAESGLKQEIITSSEGYTTTKNYKQNENGDFAETNEFLLVSSGQEGGDIYTGSEIAKMFNSENFDVDSAKAFFQKSGVGVLDVGTIRDGGSIEVRLLDGTNILYENGMTDNGNVRISGERVEEYYDKDGNKVTE